MLSKKRIVQILAGVGLVAVAASFYAEDEPLVVWPSYVQTAAFRVNGDTIYWVDDERLFFAGAAPVEVVNDGKTVIEYKSGRYIWNVVTGETDYNERRAETPVRVCPWVDRLWYNGFNWGEGFGGRPGAETLYVPRVPLESGGMDRYYFSQFRCDQIEAHEFIPGRHITALREGDGYFSYTHQVYPNPAPPLSLYHADLEDPGTPTPFQGESSAPNFYELFTSQSTYVTFKADTAREYDLVDTYFLATSNFSRETAASYRECLPVYWFWPGKEHRYQKVCLPMNSNWSNVGATKIGYILSQQMFNAGGDIFTSGVYLVLYGDTPFTTTRMVKLFTGLTGGRLAVSPNGCKIAWFSFSRFGWNQAKAKQKLAGLKIIDLCANADAIRALPTAPPLRDHLTY